MLVVFPFCPKDYQQAVKNARWIASLKHNNPHHFLLLHDARTDPIEVQSILGARHIIGTHRVTDVHNRWPHSANTMFSQAARTIQGMPDIKYWLWLEPDAILLGDYALDKLETEYTRVNAVFMGARTNAWKNCPAHLSGVAIYPNPLVQYAGAVLLSEGESTPFDIIDAERVITQSHLTDMIQNVARKAERTGDTWVPVQEARSFSSREDFYSVATKECVLFHADKTGSLIDIFGGAGVKERGADVERSSTGDQETPPVPPPPQPMLRQPTENEESSGMVYQKGGWSKAIEADKMQDHVAWLKQYAELDGFARMRTYRQLIQAGLRERKEEPEKKRRKWRRKQVS